MQGVIFDQLERYAVRELGGDALARIRDLTGSGATGYRFDSDYPDEGFQVILRGVAEATGRTTEQVAEDFGRALVPALFDIYGFLVDPSWNFFEFLLKTETTIHRGVKLNSRGARPPVIQAALIGSKTIKIAYRSERRLCRVAFGIIRGAASRYGVEITIAEELCMLRGDPECLIMVSGTA